MTPYLFLIRFKIVIMKYKISVMCIQKRVPFVFLFDKYSHRSQPSQSHSNPLFFCFYFLPFVRYLSYNFCSLSAVKKLTKQWQIIYSFTPCRINRFVDKIKYVYRAITITIAMNSQILEKLFS